MAAKLKVFTWSDGFHAYTVATSSRAKALAAWGVTRDLFKDGDATESLDGVDHDAALASPGEIIKRGLAVDVGLAVPMPRAKAPKAPDKAALARLAALEGEMKELEDTRAAEIAEFRRNREALDQREGEAIPAHARRVKAMQARLTEAKRRLEGKS